MGNCCFSFNKKDFQSNSQNDDGISQIIASSINKCICKINIQNKTGIKKCTGFFCHIPEKSIRLLITNSHNIDEHYLNKENKLIYNEMENELIKEINLKKDRYKLIDKQFDFTIIEILQEDNINNFLVINDEFYKKNDQIFAYHNVKREKLKLSLGKIIEKGKNYLKYEIGLKEGSSGSPIILMKNLKVVGLHKAFLNDNSNNKLNLGIPIEFIIDKINMSYFNIQNSNVSNVNYLHY